MFYDDPKFEKIGQDIYVYKNFISKQEIDSIMAFVEDNPDLWANNDPNKPQERSSSEIPQLKNISSRLNKIVGRGHFVKQNASMIRLLKGDDWQIHSDNHNSINIRKLAKMLKNGEDFSYANNNIYGIVLYFNEFEGGEIFYPTQDVEYKPKAGDLVIHSSDEHCEHGVKPVLSEVRYSYSNAIYEVVKIPKTRKK